MGRKSLKKKKALARAEALSAAKKKQAKKLERKHSKTKPEGKSGEAVTATKASSYSVEDYMTKVEEYLDSFQVELAVKFCERALELEPENVYVLNTMASTLLEAGEPDRAFELFQREVALSPDSGHTKYLYLGQLTHGEEAIGHLTKGIELLSRGVEEEEGGACAAMEGRRDELSSAYCALAEVYLTDTCFDSDAGQRCYESCCKAVELSPSNPEAYQLLASCLLSQQLQDKAREAVMKGLSLWVPSLRGSKDCESEGASLPSEDETSHFPSYPSRMGVAKLLMELEEHDVMLAFEVLEGLLREDDEVVGVWYLMGWLHYLTKDADSARFYLEHMQKLYVKLCCDEEDILMHATELLKELGPPLPGIQEGVEQEAEGEEEDHMADIQEEEGKEKGEGLSAQSEAEDSCSEDGMDIT